MHIVGPNGSGKTTLIRILAGLANLGVKGKVVVGSSWLYIGHQGALKGQLTVLGNLSRDLSGWPIPSNQLLSDALSKLELGSFKNCLVSSLSAGQRRRVSLARIFLTKHSIWLLDEPFTSLDKSAILEVERGMQDHLHDGGAIVISSHHKFNLPEAKVDTISLETRP